ncbi:MAG TPA: peptidylprolyl isomerase, partial [Flavobacteriales bacterium]|nr:peptidylprolyl isomerase [Flavobacteriales bacterium]
RNNPEKRSDPYAFYFVEGSLYNDLTLDKYEQENNYAYSEEQRAYYKQNPGAAHIDGQHTVFGEIIEGFEVIAKLTHVKTDGRDWPISDIYIERCEVID